MTVAELIQELKSYEKEGFGDLPVRFVYDYHDHWHTSVAPEVTQVDVGAVEHSEYHSQMRVIDPEDEDEENEKQEQAVLLT